MGSKFRVVVEGSDATSGLAFNVGDVTLPPNSSVPGGELPPCYFPIYSLEDSSPNCIGTFLNGFSLPAKYNSALAYSHVKLSISFYNPNFDFEAMEVDATVAVGTPLGGSTIEGLLYLQVAPITTDCTAPYSGVSSGVTYRVQSGLSITRTGADTWRIDVENLSLPVGEYGWAELPRTRGKGTSCRYYGYYDPRISPNQDPATWGFWTDPLNFSMTLTRTKAP